MCTTASYHVPAAADLTNKNALAFMFIILIHVPDRSTINCFIHAETQNTLSEKRELPTRLREFELHLIRYAAFPICVPPWRQNERSGVAE